MIVLASVGCMDGSPSSENTTNQDNRRDSNGPYQATGIKIGEVTDTSAIIWTRLTENPTRVGEDAPFPEIRYKYPDTGVWEPRDGRKNREVRVTYPEGFDVTNIEGAVPGIAGDVKVNYKPANSENWSTTGWEPVVVDHDFIRQFKLPGLIHNTLYDIVVESRTMATHKKGDSVKGTFRTAPASDDISTVLFTVTTGTAYGDRDLGPKGYKMYAAMSDLNSNFFVHTGDILYYDSYAKTPELARWHWDRMYSLPSNVEFHRKTPAYFIKDDHDTWMNDCWPGQETRFMGAFTFDQGLEIFIQEVPMSSKTYRTFRWGKDQQIWLVEGRDYRSPNNMPDGPEKTIWGVEQKTWFKNSVTASNATFKILISPTPIVGPDRENKRDNHSNKVFAHEGNEIRNFIAGQENMFVACGDRHWQYVSHDLKTGIHEFSCGPGSNEHAGGWKNDMIRPEHDYLNVTGGFLSVTIDRQEGTPTLFFRHHIVEGNTLNEVKFISI